MTGITIKNDVHFTFGRRSKKVLQTVPAPAPVTARVPRVAKLLALAIRFEKLIRDGHVADYAELARLGHVTRARLTQIMNLLVLAPHIHEAILFLQPVREGKDPITERELRHVVVELDWGEQRERWQTTVPSTDIAVVRDASGHIREIGLSIGG